MAIYRAFDIAENASARPKLNEEQIDNIEQVIRVILDNLLTNKIYYQIPEERSEDGSHPIVKYNENAFVGTEINEYKVDNELIYLAKKLLFEEQVVEKDGKRRRNKKIKEGLLFAKHTLNQLILLKFEDTQIIDKKTFRPIEGLSVDKQYYKIVVIDKDNYNNITVVDRNKVIAKYWASGFLELERKRDSHINTLELIEGLEKDTLINHEIGFSANEYANLKQQVRDFIIENSSFDKEQLFSTLKFDSNKHMVDADSFFASSLFDVIDADFEINKEVVIKSYKKTIRVSKSSKITVDNLFRELKRDNIELKGNNLILKIDAEYKGSVQEIIASGKENG
ncbi:hypothetical protein G7175_002260 [Listeria monocytogenes]|nr:hypothetical protein [Listeria monocytogenes]EEP0531130.1 hypothetical protein [Listeria monocytogenes]EHL5791246.1 hypothetical protein [Listeria monocytogenes]